MTAETLASAPLMRSPQDCDWTQIGELMRVEFQHEFDLGSWLDTAKSLAGAHKAGLWCRVMAARDTVIGFVSLDLDSPHPSIAKLAVHKEFRHRGYGERLMKAAEEEARARGFAKVCVAVVKVPDRTLLNWYKNRLNYFRDPQFLRCSLRPRDGFKPIPVRILSKRLTRLVPSA
jgi:ribosomal protein S18 acetylase RimI-like enzyme